MGRIRTKYPLPITRACDGCDTLFKPDMRDVMEGKGRFCSRACSDKHRNFPGPTAERVNISCSFCSTSFERKKNDLVYSKSGLFFCSRLCKDKAQRLESNIQAIWLPHYGTGEASYREIAFRHYGKECISCGYNKYEAVLQVHHKDRNRQNNHPSNLEVLCPTCHIERHYLSGDGFWSPRKNLVDRAEIESAPEPCRGSMLPVTPSAHLEKSNITSP